MRRLAKRRARGDSGRIMNQSGKIVAYVCTVLSAGAMLGVSILFIGAPWIGLSRSPAQSEQAKTSADAAGKQLAEVRALAGTVSGQPTASETQFAGSGPAGEAAAPPPEWSAVEVGAALMECVSLLAPVNAQVIPLAPVRYNDCGTPAPVLLRSIGGKDRIAVDPPLVMNCPMVAALSRWLEKTVQPAARATLGSPVARIVGSSYACRNLYNLPNERRSQHAYANAIDLPVFFLADGRKVDLTQGWGPTRRDLVAGLKLVPIVAMTPEGAVGGGGVSTADMKMEANGASMTVVKASAEQPADGAAPAPKAAPLPDPLAAPEARFLRRVHRGACDVFSTVLGPEANDVHRTHLHLDLQDRNALNVCQ
jgi:hypothetical protein